VRDLAAPAPMSSIWRRDNTPGAVMARRQGQLLRRAASHNPPPGTGTANIACLNATQRP